MRKSMRKDEKEASEPSKKRTRCAKNYRPKLTRSCNKSEAAETVREDA